MVHQKSIRIATKGRGFTDITSRVAEVVAASGIRTGLCTVFIHHTSASLVVNENADPDVRGDLERYMSRLVSDGDPIFRHIEEGPDDMSAHVRSVLTATSLNLPVAGGRCDLGTWQGIYLWEHRKSKHSRRVSITVVGC